VLKSLQYDSAVHFIIVEWECNSAIKAGLTLKSLMWTQISIATWWLRQKTTVASQELESRVLKTIRIECFGIYFAPHFFSIFQMLPVGGVRLWPGV